MKEAIKFFDRDIKKLLRVDSTSLFFFDNLARSHCPAVTGVKHGQESESIKKASLFSTSMYILTDISRNWERRNHIF